MHNDRLGQGTIDALMAAGLTRRRLLQGMGAAGLALATPAIVAPGARAADRAARPQHAGDIPSLTWGVLGTLARMSIDYQTTLADEEAIANVIEVLVNYDAYGRIVPMLAESWTQKDPQTYVYKIRQGVKFSDGTPLTMDDVLASCLETWQKPTVIAPLLAAIRAIQVTGPQELTIRLKAPSATFKYIPTFMNVKKKSEIATLGNKAGSPGHLGTYTGPYALQAFVPGQSATLVRNEHYWGKKPAAAQLNYKPFKDATTMRLAFQSGAIDLCYGIPYSDLAAWGQLSNAHLILGGPARFVYVSMDTHQAPWSDVHVRRAIAHCVDKQGIVKAIYRGAAQAANTYPFPIEWAGVGLSVAQAQKLTSQIPDYALDLAKAKAELAQSSRPHGFTDNIIVPSDTDPHLTLIAETIVQNAKSIGITLNLKSIPSTQWYGGWLDNKKNTGCTLIDNGATFLDPSDYARIQLLKQFDTAGSYNSANYYNPAVEALLKRADESTSNATRRDSILAALKIAGRDEPYVPIVWEGGVMAINKKYNFVDGPYNSFICTLQEWAERIIPA